MGGQTCLDAPQVSRLVQELRKEWPGKAYNVMGPNCQTYAQTFVERLGVAGTIPQQYCRFADGGSMPRSVVDALSNLGLSSPGLSVGKGPKPKRTRPVRARPFSASLPTPDARTGPANSGGEDVPQTKKEGEIAPVPPRVPHLAEGVECTAGVQLAPLAKPIRCLEAL